VHVAVIGGYVLTRPPPPALVRVVVGGDGSGTVMSTPAGVSCGEDCLGHFAPGTSVKLLAVLGDDATFEGWSGDCEVNPDYIFECTLTATTEHEVKASFGVMPERVEVAFQELPPDDATDDMTVTLPSPAEEAKLIAKAPPLEELLQEPPPQLQVQPVVPAPPVPELAPKKEQPKQQEDYTLKSVEVPDENLVDKAPDDARYLSDKNRDVAEETRAEDTNLEKQQKGEAAYSEKSDVSSDDIGSEKAEIAELEDTESTSLETDQAKPTSASGQGEVAKGQLKGDEGAGGDDGQAGDGDSGKKQGLLSMRGITGRGAPGGPTIPDSSADDDTGGKSGAPGKRGRRGLQTQLSWNDFERIVGKEELDKQAELAQKSRSSKRGRWERKMAAIRSSLENFNSEVKTGNQTALKTRAAPFAVYIARMHRRIHKLWGFGFLEDLDDLPASHQLNNWGLEAKLEIIINPDGSLDKVNIINPSGVSMFDIAAIDALYTSGPFEPTPEEIRSPDGKIYIHWTFHRDWRQCGTFAAQPFILDKAPKSSGRGDTASSRPGEVRMPRVRQADVAEMRRQAAEATARATANMPTPDDPKAEYAANIWLSGYAQNTVAKMVEVSGVPFSSAGTIVANNAGELATVYRNLMRESSRAIRDYKLLSAAGFRRRFGNLPQGTNLNGTDLFLVVRTQGEQFTLVVRQGAGGEYRIVGLLR